jgi:hypothetical protein
MSRRRVQKGQKRQALDRSRGNFTAKIYGKAGGSGDLIAFDLTGGKASNCSHFETCSTSGRACPHTPPLPTKAIPAMRTGPRHSSAHPTQSQRKEPPAFFAKALYKARGHIEQGCAA